jgi:hypothetical protein
MTGKDPSDNYVAEETADHHTTVKYADGSGYEQDADGKLTVHGKHGGLGVLDVVLGSASNSYLATEWQLIGNFWAARDETVALARHEAF